MPRKLFFLIRGNFFLLVILFVMTVTLYLVVSKRNFSGAYAGLYRQHSGFFPAFSRQTMDPLAEKNHEQLTADREIHEGKEKRTNSKLVAEFKQEAWLTERTGRSLQKSACEILKLDPYHKLAMDEMMNVGKIDCIVKDFGVIKSRSLIVEGKSIRNAYFRYVQRSIGDDSEVEFSDPVLLMKATVELVKLGRIGCLAAGELKVLEFEGDDDVSRVDHCTADNFFEILSDGRIRNFMGKFLTVKDCYSDRCPLVLRHGNEKKTSRFHFESDGVIRHFDTSMCVNFISDVLGNYDELVLTRDCNESSSKWWIHGYSEKDINITEPLTEDFIELVVIKHKTIYKEYHATVIPKVLEDTEETLPDYNDKLQDQFNVVLIMLESQSAANAERNMRDTFQYLKQRESSFIFKGHSIVGDGTTDQLCAMLIGQLEKDLPDALKSTQDSVYVDNWPFIFTNFREKGYMTLFSEDDINFSAFNYRLNGFKDPPTNHYARAFWQAAAPSMEDWRCVGGKPIHKINLDYTESLFDAYPSRPKFSVTVLSALTHNNMNNIQYVDEDLRQFLINMDTKGHLRNTFIAIVGDHGIRAAAFRASFAGWLEERLPFFSLSVPASFLQSNPNVREAIKSNTETLTSHFDIYATLLNILYKSWTENKTIGNSLLSSINRETRTCQSAGIARHWCPCRYYRPLQYENKRHIEMAKAAVAKINTKINQFSIAKTKCAELEFDSLQSVGQSRLDMELTARNMSQTTYLIVFIVKPNSAIFEATVSHFNPDIISVDPDISRLDLYGDQPKCILKDYPNLRKFCFCKNSRLE